MGSYNLSLEDKEHMPLKSSPKIQRGFTPYIYRTKLHIIMVFFILYDDSILNVLGFVVYTEGFCRVDVFDLSFTQHRCSLYTYAALF